MVEQIEMDIEESTGTKLDKLYNELKPQLKSALDDYLESIKKPSTLKVYRSTLINFLHRNNNPNPLFLKQYNSTMWQAYAQENLVGSASTVNTKVSAIRAFFDHLIKTGKRSSNPLEGYQLLVREEKSEQRINLTWEQIKSLKLIQDEKMQEVFNWGYIENKKISETGRDGSYIDYHVKAMGKAAGIEGLKYSDLTAARKRYFATCPITGQELEMTEENWVFKDGLLQAKVNKTNGDGLYV
jgi:hypothetical protein